MIGQRIESLAVFPWASVILAVAAAGLLVLALVERSAHPAVAALLPLAVAIALVLARPRPFVAELTEDGLHVSDPEYFLPYRAVEGLTAEGKPTADRVKLHIFHAGGVIVVPPRLNLPSSEVYGFLASRLSESGSRKVPAVLENYLRRQIDEYGDAAVFSYRARPHLKPVAWKHKVAACLAASAAGLAWVAVGFLGGREFIHWIVTGGAIAILFALAALAYGLNRQRSPAITNWQQSGLVIGPAGLALTQGKMRGEMRWEELGNVEYWPVSRLTFVEAALSWWVNWSDDRGIILAAPAARIVIKDLYDRPLPLIYDRILTHWQDGGFSEPEA